MFVLIDFLMLLASSSERLFNSMVFVWLSQRSIATATCSWFAAARAWAADNSD